MLNRNGWVAVSTPSSSSRFHRSRSEAVGLSSAAKSGTVTLPFQDALVGAPSGMSMEIAPFAASAPAVNDTLAWDSTYGRTVTRLRPDTSSRPENDTGLVASTPFHIKRPRSPTRA